MTSPIRKSIFAKLIKARLQLYPRSQPPKIETTNEHTNITYNSSSTLRAVEEQQAAKIAASKKKALEQ